MNPPTHADRDLSALCRCGHSRDLHEHYRPGSDCGVGGPQHCAAFHHATPLLTRMRLRVRPATAAATTPELAPVFQLIPAAHRAR